MKRRTVVFGLAAVAGLALAAVTGYRLYWGTVPESEPFSPSQQCGASVPVADYRLSGPYTHDNLTVFLVHGPETLHGKPFLTLQDALEQSKAVVNETGSVNQLSIENLATDEELYVQSGDIVKGGNQDRTLPYDAVVEPKSGPVAIDSFCVEHGRWSKRGAESSGSFSISSDNMKQVAYSGEASQAEVWRNVALTQDRLSKKLGDSVKAEASKSSLQLTLETSAVRSALTSYLQALGPTPDGRDDVIGYVAVINGQFHSADVYASRSLFLKLWPKLLQGTAVEAFIEADAGRKFDPAGEDAVRAVLTQAESGKPRSEAVTKRTYVQLREAGKTVMLESCDRSRENLVLHRSFLVPPERGPEH
jgi:hypothetical protein